MMSQNNAWQSQLNELKKQYDKLSNSDKRFYNDADTLLNWCKNSHDIFIKGTPDEKRFIAQIIVSNISYKDKKLSVELHPLFNSLLNSYVCNWTLSLI